MSIIRTASMGFLGLTGKGGLASDGKLPVTLQSPGTKDLAPTMEMSLAVVGGAYEMGRPIYPASTT